MSEKLDFIKRLKPRLPQIEKDSLYLKLLETAQENLQLEEVCMNLEEGIVIADAKGHPVFVNRKADDWLGGVRAAVKQPVWNQTQDLSFAAFLKENVVTAGTRTVHDLRILSPREMQLRVTILPREQEGKTNFVILLSDITSRTEQEFETAGTNGIVSLQGISKITDAEKELIQKALRETRGNKSTAAEKLGISRRTLYRKLEEYKLA